MTTAFYIMKNIYLLAISLLFFTIEMTATPVQTANSKTEITAQKKPTFKERIAHKFLKKKLKKIKEKNNLMANEIPTFWSPILGVVSLAAWIASIAASFTLSLGGVIVAIIIGFGAGIAGMIIGIRALRANRNRGFAIAGVLLSGLALLISLANSVLALANL